MEESKNNFDDMLKKRNMSEIKDYAFGIFFVICVFTGFITLLVFAIRILIYLFSYIWN